VVTLTQTPTIALVKSLLTNADQDGSGSVTWGDTLTYSFVVTNTGNVTLTNVTVSDPLPGLGVISPAPVASLAPGASAVFTAAYTVTQADMDQADGTIDNTAMATGTPPGGGTVSDDDTLAVPVAQGPAIQIVKTYVDVNGGTVLLGDALTYTFTVTNTGNVTLTNVTVSDPLPGLGVISPAPVASLAPGASAVFTAAYTVTQADMDQADGTIDNTAMATGTPPGGGTVSDDDTLAVPVAQGPAIQIVKTYVDVNGGTVLLGDALTYTFTVTNTGNVTLTNVTVSDPLPGLGVISPAPVASLAPGASAVFTAAYTVTQADMDQADGTIDNTATATGTPPGGGTVSDDDTLAVPVAQGPAIQIVKTYEDVNGGTVLLGDALTYTFTVTNTGNVTLTNVTVSDPLPGLGVISPVPVASLAPGASAVFTAAYTVTQADMDQADGTIDNTATATGTPPGGGTVSDDDTLAVPVAQGPAIQIVKTYEDVNGGTVLLGDALTYTFTVTNTGNVTLTNVTVSDPLPGLGALVRSPWPAWLRARRRSSRRRTR
jgi:uncharacterized repeat protein (TIGR01451 family)